MVYNTETHAKEADRWQYLSYYCKGSVLEILKQAL